MYADAYETTPRSLLIPPGLWELEGENPFGTREWEAQVLEAHGLLDTAEDPERWHDVERGAAGVQAGVGGGQVPAQAPPLDSEDSEDDFFSGEDPQDQWGDPNPADPNWVCVWVYSKNKRREKVGK